MKPLQALSAVFAGCAGLTLLNLIPAKADEIGHLKAIDYNGETLVRVKALDNGKQYPVKVLINKDCATKNGTACLHAVKALINGEKVSVKAISKEPNGRVSVKAITKSGRILDIKGIKENGEILDVKALITVGSLTHGVKAFNKQSEAINVKGFDKSGGFYHIKAITTEGPKSINGVKYWGDIKAISY